MIMIRYHKFCRGSLDDCISGQRRDKCGTRLCHIEVMAKLQLQLLQLQKLLWLMMVFPEAQDAISQAQEDLDFAETIDEVDAILSSLESLEISIPDGITSFAESKKKV